MSHEHEYMTVKEVAELLRVHERTVWRMVDRGDLRHVRVGRQIRIPSDALNDLRTDDTPNESAA